MIRVGRYVSLIDYARYVATPSSRTGRRMIAVTQCRPDFVGYFVFDIYGVRVDWLAMQRIYGNL